MAKYLVIVESPAKVKTIKKFLGKDYEVVASQGHVRDLPKSSLGIDIEHDYTPHYITIRGKGDILAKLRKEVKKATKVYLATDPDREGEAIAWHLAQALKLEGKQIHRISFNEITEKAVKESIKQSRDIDVDLVDAQQTRRMLDRMVGYRISPLLWAKVKRGLSAGRVQSVALRMICDREDEINAFIPEEYWTLEAAQEAEGETKPVTAKFYGKNNEKTELHNKEEVDEVLKALEGKRPVVTEVKEGERIKKAPLPFTTSTLQQEASKVLNFSTQKTMRIAQSLYEGVELAKLGTVGLITYLRTDSIRVSEGAVTDAAAYITETFGAPYLTVRSGNGAPKSEKKIQDAHEAIRPTDIRLTPSQVKESLSRDEFRLYQLIWKRFTASQMHHALYKTMQVKIAIGEYTFTVSTAKLVFDGFMCVYVSEEDKEENKKAIRSLQADSVLSVLEYTPKQHFTQPPQHYTEASLVKALEEQGIGRPSTYAPTITTLLGRRYITKETRNLYVTEIGEVVNQLMKQSFPSIVDVTFTANLESLLDKIEEGSINWKTVLENFYPDLDEAVRVAEEQLAQVKIEDEVSDEICENCGRNMVIKYGPHGKFLACPGFPECRNTKPYLEKIGVPCPKCGKDIVIRKTKKGRKYYGCEGAPECDFMSWIKPTDQKCPICGKCMLQKGNKLFCADDSCVNGLNNLKNS